MSHTMKAVVYKEYGSPDVLHVETMPKPAPKDNEILIRVQARSINYGDLLARNFGNATMRDFNMPGILYFPTRLVFGLNKPNNPILGSEFSGDVEAVGQAVTQFKPGDAVFGYLGQSMGANAEYITLAEDGMVTHKPQNMSYEEAAVIPYGALTALNLLRKVAIQPGQKVLIIGASGSIGAGALQLARHYGAEVTGIAGTARQDYMKSLGADHVLDYTREDFTKNGQTYDVIIDVLGKSSFTTVKPSLTANGAYLRVSFKMREVFQMLGNRLRGGKKVITALSAEQPHDLVTIRELAEAGIINAQVDQCFPMEQAAEAHRYAESGRKSGSVVIRTTA